MQKQLSGQDLTLNEIMDLIESEQLFIYEDWKSYLPRFIAKLNSSDFSKVEKTIINNSNLFEFVQSTLELPETLWATMTITNGQVYFELIDSPYPFLTVDKKTDIEVDSHLNLSQKVKVCKQKQNLSSYYHQENTLSVDSILKSDVNKTVAACLIAFSLQLPTALNAGSTDVHSEAQKAQMLLKSNYESLQGTKNKNFIPLMKSMYKINELTSQDYYQEDKEVVSFEKEEMVNHVAEMISSFNPREKKNAHKYAKKILEVSKTQDIDYRIVLAIIKEESAFDQTAYNPSGDYSIAQINYGIWSAQFKEMKKKPINFKKLKADSDYSITLMGDILSYLKNAKKKNADPLWYATYHSKTPKKKLMYAQKIQRNMRQIDALQQAELQDSIMEFNLAMSQIDRSELINSGIDEDQLQKLSHGLYAFMNKPTIHNLAYNGERDIDD